MEDAGGRVNLQTSSELERDSMNDMLQSKQMANLGYEPEFMKSLAFGRATMLGYSAKTCRHVADAYQEWLNFIGRRLEEDAQFAEKLSQLKNPEELTSAYSAFLAKAAQDYQNEFAAIAKITGELSNEMTDAVQDLGKSPAAGAVLGE